MINRREKWSFCYFRLQFERLTTFRRQLVKKIKFGKKGSGNGNGGKINGGKRKWPLKWSGKAEMVTLGNPPQFRVSDRQISNPAWEGGKFPLAHPQLFNLRLRKLTFQIVSHFNAWTSYWKVYEEICKKHYDRMWTIVSLLLAKELLSVSLH